MAKKKKKESSYAWLLLLLFLGLAKNLFPYLVIPIHKKDKTPPEEPPEEPTPEPSPNPIIIINPAPVVEPVDVTPLPEPFIIEEPEPIPTPEPTPYINPHDIPIYTGEPIPDVDPFYRFKDINFDEVPIVQNYLNDVLAHPGLSVTPEIAEAADALMVNNALSETVPIVGTGLALMTGAGVASVAPSILPILAAGAGALAAAPSIVAEPTHHYVHHPSYTPSPPETFDVPKMVTDVTRPVSSGGWVGGL